MFAPLITEGTRSRDGRLGEFKRGPFTMAQRAGVRIVPVTIMGVAKAMPFFAMAPLCKVSERASGLAGERAPQRRPLM